MSGPAWRPFLRELARAAPAETAIVELGSWMGAVTAQLALGLRSRQERHGIVIHSYDRWQATEAEVKKAWLKRRIQLESGQDTLPLVKDILAPFGETIRFHKGQIIDAEWCGDPISVHIDDATKSTKPFYHSLRTFGPCWMPGQTIVVLMDYNHWRRSGKETHKCQLNFIEAHRAHFVPVDTGRDNYIAFRYEKPLSFSTL